MRSAVVFDLIIDLRIVRSSGFFVHFGGISGIICVIAVMASLLYKERLAIQEKIGVVLELAGVIVMFVWEGFKGSEIGLAILLVSAFSFALYNILQREVCKYYDVLDAIGYCTISASMPLLFFVPKEILSHSKVPVKAWLCIVALGVLCSVVAYILWASALKNARKTMEIANCQYINILITTMTGFVVLAEIPDIQTIVGAIITITGMVIFGKGSIEYLLFYCSFGGHGNTFSHLHAQSLC